MAIGAVEEALSVLRAENAARAPQILLFRAFAHFAQWARGKRLRLQRIDGASIVPFNVIALWLGHECMTTTHRYVEADLAMKEKALARLEPPNTKMRRCQAPDSLMRFLQTL